MNRLHISAAVRTAATLLASIATTCALLSAVVSLSEPQRSRLMAATASRQLSAQPHVGRVALAQPAQPAPVAEVTTR